MLHADNAILRESDIHCQIDDDEMDGVRIRKLQNQEEEEVDDSLKFSSPNIIESSDTDHVSDVLRKQNDTVYQHMIVANRMSIPAGN